MGDMCELNQMDQDTILAMEQDASGEELATDMAGGISPQGSNPFHLCFDDFSSLELQRAGSPRFKTIVRNMSTDYNSDVFIILEPKISGTLADRLCRSFSNFSSPN